MKKISLILILGFVLPHFSQGQTAASINPENGAKYRIENKVTTESTSEMMGQKMETKADVTSNFKIEVKNVGDENIDLTNSIMSLKMNITAMGQDISFDSEKEQDMNGDIGKNFKDYINQPKDVLMDKSGNVIVHPNADSSKNGDAHSVSLMLKQMGGDPEEEGYGAKLAFHALPINLKAGSKWSDSSSANGTTKVTHYTLKSLNGNEGTITMSGTINSELKTEMQGMEVT
ncbi:MAG: DUF6263 family protein, partial [Ginsengibacter sp.]